jgi:hypothetical protein
VLPLEPASSRFEGFLGSRKLLEETVEDVGAGRIGLHERETFGS